MENEMTHPLCVQDFDCFTFFQNVVKSKLIEAQHHLKRCELYRFQPEIINSYQLNDIIIAHEDTHEFLKTGHQQCAVWRNQSTLTGQINKIKHLEDTAKKLEMTVDHIFYVVENIQNEKNRALTSESDKEVYESETRHNHAPLFLL
jgi:hypothetical protein